MTLSASPSNDIPRLTLYFLTKDLIFLGKVDPQFLLIFKPFGEVPTLYTFAPKDFRSLGPDLYPAPFAQSIAILIPFKLKFSGKLDFKISMYLLLAFSNLLTLPRIFGLDKFFVIFESISF